LAYTSIWETNVMNVMTGKQRHDGSLGEGRKNFARGQQDLNLSQTIETAQYRSDNRLCCRVPSHYSSPFVLTTGAGNHQAVLGQAGTRARLHPECRPAWHLPRTREASAAL
jgi:hypothetical protein